MQLVSSKVRQTDRQTDRHQTDALHLPLCVDTAIIIVYTGNACTPCLKKNDNDVAHYNFNAH